MPCIVEKTKRGTSFFCYRRGKQRPKCYKCGKPATKLCDFREWGNHRYVDEYGRKKWKPVVSLDTCSKPMCDECTTSAEGLDFCEEHGDYFHIHVTLDANEVYKKMIDTLEV